MNEETPNDAEVMKLFEKLEREAKQGGYILNPDIEFTKGLIKGLLLKKESGRRLELRPTPSKMRRHGSLTITSMNLYKKHAANSTIF